MKTIQLAIAAALFVVTLTGVSNAQETASKEIPFFGVSLGLKGAVGGNLLTQADATPSWAIIYEDGAGGIGGGGGIYTEFRILKGHLGLEFDILFESNKNWGSIEFNNTVDTDWIYRFKTVRLPLLLEGSLEGDKTRVSLGVGPEFVVGTGATTDIEVTGGGQYLEPGTLDAQRRNFGAKKQTDTFLCVGLGLAIKVWKLAITLDLRYAYNLTQPDKYLDRMTIEDLGNDQYSVRTVASSTMDMRLMLGIAYELSFSP